MHDRPTAAELVAAARMYLEAELIPALTDARLRFQTLVAANVLSIVERELLSEEDHLTEEYQALGELLGQPGPVPERLSALRRGVRDANAELCRRIRRGDFDDRARFQALSTQLAQMVARKLQIANPRYLAGFAQTGAGRSSSP